MVREETSPEDIEGMRAALGLLTARGGMTNHTALVSRGWGECCIVRVSDLEIVLFENKPPLRGRIFKEGDVITLNGTLGLVYKGSIPMID